MTEDKRTLNGQVSASGKIDRLEPDSQSGNDQVIIWGHAGANGRVSV